jgi:hypothetical protein
MLMDWDKMSNIYRGPSIDTKFQFIWLRGFRGEDFKTFFPIRSYVKTTVCPLKAAT